MRRRWLAVAGLALWLGDSAGAHEFDPGYLSLTESAAGVFEVQWKVSIAGGLYAALVPRLPAECELDPQAGLMWCWMHRFRTPDYLAPTAWRI